METYSIDIDNHDLDKIEKYRHKFNTSVLTIFFTDIEDSTRLREELGDKGYTELLEKHDSMLLPVVHKYNGLHLKSIGDSILAVFSQPSDAVECAITIQDTIYNSPLIRPFLKVRIGIDMGQIAREQTGGVLKDIFGRFVNRAAKIEGLANGGHIFCSESVQDNATGWIDSSKIQWHDHGFHNVKGVKKTLKIWEPFNANITTISPITKKEYLPTSSGQTLNATEAVINNVIEFKKINQPEADGRFIARLKFNQKLIRIYLGDLTNLKTDVLVTSDDNWLTMGGGVSMNIRHKGGESIFDEARKNIPIKYGDIVVTSAGKLHSRNIFHCVVSDYEKYLYPNSDVIKQVVNKCLIKASELKLKSIVFPLLGTGASGFSKIFALESILLQLIDSLSQDIRHIEDIIIAIFGKNEDLIIISEAFKNVIIKSNIKVIANNQ